MAPKNKEEIKKEPILTPGSISDAEKTIKDSLPKSGSILSKKEDTIEIKRSDFDKLMKTIEKQTKDIDLLYKTADKSRIAKELNKEGENLIKQSSVSTWADTGRLIIGWSDMLTNISQVINGREVVDQTTNVVFEDGEVKTVPYLEFARSRTVKLLADVIGRIEEDGVLKYKLQFPTGKILVIDTKFLN